MSDTWIAKVDLLTRELSAPRPQRILESSVLRSVEKWLQNNVPSVIPAKEFELQETSASLLEAVHHLGKQNEELHAKLRSINEDVLEPLREQYQSLQQRCAQQETEIQQLQSLESHQVESLKRRLEEAEGSFTRTMQFMGNMQRGEGETAEAVRVTLERCTASIEQAAQLERENCALKLELDRLRACESTAVSLSSDPNSAPSLAEWDAANLRIALLEDELTKKALRENEMQDEVTNLRHLVDQLQLELKTTREAVVLQSLGSHACDRELKRQRIEAECPEGMSTKRELLSFWIEGHDTIEELQQKLEGYTALQQDYHNVKQRLMEIESDRAACISRFTSMAEEVERLREENINLRGQCAGADSTNDILVSELSKLLDRELSRDDIRSCCATLRQAAEKAVAASASIVFDPQVALMEMRKVQELRNELLHLTQRKESLHRFLSLREARIRSLNRATAAANIPSSELDLALDIADHVISATLCAEEESQENAERQWKQQSMAFVEKAYRAERANEDLEKRVTELSSLNEAKEHQLEQLSAELQSCRDLFNQCVAQQRAEVEQLVRTTCGLQREVDIHREWSAKTMSILRSMRGLLARSFELSNQNVGLIADLCSENHRLRLEKHNLRENGEGAVKEARANDLEILESALQQQLELLQYAHDNEIRQCDAQQVKYISALVAEVESQKEAAKKSKEEFARNVAKMAQEIIARVEAARNDWEGTLRKDLAATEAKVRLLEREQSSADKLISSLKEAIVVPHHDNSSNENIQMGEEEEDIAQLRVKFK